jgi:23S rRNA (adenine-N6)-dimethyltransferase
MSRIPARSQVERALSSHSLRSPAVAVRILAHSGLAPPDTVIEVGPGSGMLTAAIAARVRRVIAVEHDRSAWAALRSRFAHDASVEVVLGNFLDYPLPARGPYRVAGNLPFAQTSAIIRRLLGAPNPPVESILVVQREAALRWSGAIRESEVSVLAKVRFHFDVRLALRRREFNPPPSVDCAVLGIVPRDRPVLGAASERAFRALVARGFRAGRHTLRQNLRGILPPRTFDAFAVQTGLPRDAVPGDLAFEDWLALFRSTIKERPRGTPARAFAPPTANSQ